MDYSKQKFNLELGGFKRLAVLLLCLSILVSGIPIHAFAADSAPLKFNNTGDENYQSGDYTAPEKTVDYATSVMFDASVENEEDTSVSYQWYGYDEKSSTFSEMQGETAAQLKIASIGLDSPTAYKCVVSDGVQTVQYNCSILKNTSLAFVNNAGNNGSIATILGKSCSIDATATTNNGLDLTYKWYKGDTLLEGFNTGILTFDKYKITDAGTYRCEVTDGIEIINYVCTLTSESDLAFVGEDSGGGWPEYGFDFTMDATATSSSISDITYQWYAYNLKTGTYDIMAGETGNKLTLSPVVINIPLNYKCYVTDGIKTLVYKGNITPWSVLRFKYPIYGREKKYTPLGATCKLDATATTNPGLTVNYQWYKDDEELPGETSPILSIENYQLEDNGTYKCHVSDGSSYDDYQCELFAYSGLIFADGDKDYENINVLYGTDEILDASATTVSGKEITYKWSCYNPTTQSTELLPGETGATLKVKNAGADTSRYYKCEVSDGINTIEHSWYVTVDTNLKYVGQQNRNVYTKLGETCTLSGAATSSITKNITYQWYKDYKPMAGCTAETLSIENYETSDNARYKCVISDGFNEITCSFQTYVYSGLTFTGNTSDTFTIEYGSGAVLDATAESEVGKGITYQWYIRYPYSYICEMEGETGAKLSLTKEQLDKSTDYRCVVKDGYNEIAYEGYIHFDTGLKFTNVEGASTDIYLNEGDPVSVDISATSNITKNVTYTWYKNGNYIAGFHTSILKLEHYQEPAVYSCEVSDGVNTKEYKINLITNKVTNITLGKTNISLNKGDVYTLVATLNPANVQADVKWTSSNEAVATVDVNGNVTAKEAGTTIITAQVGSVVAKECTVKVNPQFTVKFVNYDNKTIGTVTVNSGEKAVAPMSPTRKGYTFKGWDKKFNNVTGDLVVKAVFSEIVPTSIKLSVTAKKLKAKESFTLVSTVLPADSNNKVVSYRTSNSKVATVSGNGVVTGKNSGTATITVKTVNGKTANCKITVIKEPTFIKLNAKTKTLKKGKTFQIKATLSKGSTSTITFKSSNKSVVTVSSKGKLKAIKKGTATITATTSNGKTASIKVKVK